ncbi:MAG: GYD domain-containing protein [Chloroflexota bacterium]|nr:GYD domain-containing protein [Chloroflexota bacterium]
MQKYLFYGSYTPEGYQGLMKEGGTARIDVSIQALKSVGGSLEAFFYSNGEQDFYIIANLPDHIVSTAVTLIGNASGTFRIRAVPLLTPAEMDDAIKLNVDFRPPGE